MKQISRFRVISDYPETISKGIGAVCCWISRRNWYFEIVIFEDMPGEWQEWLELTPIERFRQSEKIFAQYLAMGGSLDPDPDPTSPFYDPETSSSGAAYGRPGLRVPRRGPILAKMLI